MEKPYGKEYRPTKDENCCLDRMVIIVTESERRMMTNDLFLEPNHARPTSSVTQIRSETTEKALRKVNLVSEC